MRVTLTHPLQQTLPVYHLGGRGHSLHIVPLKLQVLLGEEKNVCTFDSCHIADGGFKRIILKQLTLPFSVMVCHLLMNDQLRKAFRRI